MKELPYSVITPNLPYAAQEWCSKYFGPRWEAVGNRDGTWTCFWAGRTDFKNYVWHFEKEEDANWFALRWI